MGILHNSKLQRMIKLSELADIVINDMKLTRNDIVVVHTSLQFIDLVDSQPKDLIFLLKMIIGIDGTILMPALSAINDISNFELSHKVKNSIDGEEINEIFRQLPDTVQIGKPYEFISMWGKTPKYLTEGHITLKNESCKSDLLYNLSQSKAKIIGIGIPFSTLNYLNIDNNSCFLSHDLVSRHFNEEGIMLFKKRGIHYFCVDAEKAFNKWHLIA